VRTRPKPGEPAIYWSVDTGEIDTQALEGLDVVIHLAGEPLATARWTDAKKEAILQIRKKGTELLANALATLKHKPALFISASAVGYYGSTGDAWVDEESALGEGFLAEVCQAWEQASEPARAAGIRLVNARIGIVWASTGGALEKMLPLFKLGVGGRLGPGDQYMSWIGITDVSEAISFIIDHEELAGPVNICAPEPATNAELTKRLGEVLNRPTIFPVPAFALRLAMGKELAEEALLGGQRVRPRRLIEAGYTFRFPELEACLRHVLDRE
jgi:uncharacterized protein (TIGR01777 family)